MRPIARALRVFVQEENLPCVVHCIHGKDRTGLLVALLLLLLGVDEPAVVLDYTKSELEIKVNLYSCNTFNSTCCQLALPLPPLSFSSGRFFNPRH